MLLYPLSDCHCLSTEEIPLGGKNPLPALHRNVGAIGEVVCLREIQVAQERKKTMAMHLSGRRMKFFTVSLYPGIQPPEGAWTRGK